MQFLDVFRQMIDDEQLRAICEELAPVPRTPPKMRAEKLVTSLVFHQLHGSGTLAQHSHELHGIFMSDSAHTQRRERLPVELFEEVVRHALVPLAVEGRDEDCFFEDLRLLGTDGSQFSALNTPVILQQLPKAASRRFEAAFAKLRLVTVIELGTHAPVCAVVAPASEGEQTVAKKLWAGLPENSLNVMDRLFGTARTLDEAMTANEGRNVHFLARVKANIKVKVVAQLSDASTLIDVPVTEGNKVIKHLRLREINARGIGRDGKAFTLRLWTTLLDHRRYAADPLAQGYAQRWESELFFHELKIDVRGAPVLASHTLETALQEVLALILASAVMARLRMESADRLDVPARRISFSKLLVATRKVWNTYELAGSDLPKKNKEHIWLQYVENVRHFAILPERRDRTCPRVLRQPVSKWARKLNQPSFKGKVTLEVVPA